ncbi:carbamate kinase [Carbonactinospora thermoautotrophica]|uniref:carbamate kinase n=1 Tax=Carbonactinospora thermoautotrophica TaxID=1469144 RepID=UPI0022715297|nr:carbamate kinase [Carbonactinospora thermoautotrophica]MCX9190242.1 carbamate kinase [Carbonactinospora thermoautotrophica]
MRVVAALGGNALLRRGEPLDAEVQLKHLAEAVAALAPLADRHELVVTHGNGPQVGLLAEESTIDPRLHRPYPLDALDAQTQGMIGYWLVREMRRARPGREVVALITQTVVREDDPAFARPTKFVGPVYSADEAARLAEDLGWVMRPDGGFWRRVVPSPEPHDIVELPIIHRLLQTGCVVIAAGGGGVPVVVGPDGPRGVEAVIDKDLAAALLAERLDADALLLLTDVPYVMRDFGTARQRPITEATPGELRRLGLPAGSMGPKAEAACRFAERRPGSIAVIGELTDAAALLAGETGTRIVAEREVTGLR